MLTGRPPFEGDNATATALARLTSEPLRPRQVRAGIPRAVEEIVLRAMARQADDRYRSAEELRAALLGVDLHRLPMEDHTTSFEPAEPPPVPGDAPGFARRERSWLVPAALILVVAITLGIVGVLIGRTEVGQKLLDSGKGAASDQPVKFGDPTSFDPAPGDGAENDAELGNLHDGDPATVWHTDRYRSAKLGGLKSGVGVVLPLAEATTLHGLVIRGANSGWTASVFVADSPAVTLGGWGKAVATLRADGETTVDLDGHRGAAVLLWITNVGPDLRVSIGDIQLRR
jgi:hypothetical protein